VCIKNHYHIQQDYQLGHFRAFGKKNQRNPGMASIVGYIIDYMLFSDKLKDVSSLNSFYYFK